MILYFEKRQKTLPYRILSAFIAFTFAFSLVLSPGYAQLIPQTLLNLPAPGTMVATSAAFTPALINGITIHPENPLEFDFIVGTGDEKLEGKAFEEESTRLIKYFLASLTVPEDQMWVNLSPYEKDRIVPQGFGQTEMGRDLLAQDYILKQLTASLMYPEKELGQKFWDKIYKKAKEQFGTAEIPMNTFNKVWIVPEKAVVYEHGNSAFVVKSHLKVMLEEDYVAMNSNVGNTDLRSVQGQGGVSSEIIKEIILPEIEKEVNEGQTFAQLRQIYNSVILAAWFKQNLRETLLGQVYVDKTKTKGVDVEDKEINQKIYSQYLEAFKKGVYNYIKEDTDPATQEIIPRKYFSGGTTMTVGDLVETYKTEEGAQTLSDQQQEVLGEYLAGQEEYNRGRKMLKVNLVELSENTSVADAQRAIEQAQAFSLVTLSEWIERTLAGEENIEIPAVLREAEQKKRAYVIGGNLKMNLTPLATGKLIRDMAEKIKRVVEQKRATWKDLENIDIVIAPSYTSLAVARQTIDELTGKLTGKGIIPAGLLQLGAQDVSGEQPGAQTGEESAESLKELGVSYVILGHSERRHGPTPESSELVNKKAKRALEKGLTPIIAVGETIDAYEGKFTYRIIKDQFTQSSADIDLQKIVIAYEPVWAIGTGLTPTPQEANRVQRFIRALAMNQGGDVVGEVLPIQYGGSMTPKNVDSFIAEPSIDGGLIGGSALKPDEFIEIVVKSLEHYLSASSEDLGKVSSPVVEIPVSKGKGESFFHADMKNDSSAYVFVGKKAPVKIEKGPEGALFVDHQKANGNFDRTGLNEKERYYFTDLGRYIDTFDPAQYRVFFAISVDKERIFIENRTLSDMNVKYFEADVISAEKKDTSAGLSLRTLAASMNSLINKNPDPLITGVKSVEIVNQFGDKGDDSARAGELWKHLGDLMDVTGAAALYTSRFLATNGNKAISDIADGEATRVFRKTLNSLSWLNGVVVIGEGERDEAPMLYIGEKVGKLSSQDKEADVGLAMDVVELTKGVYNEKITSTVSVMALAQKGGLLAAPDVYLRVVMAGKKAYENGVKLDVTKSVESNLQQIVRALGKEMSVTTGAVLYRPRHKKLIRDILRAGVQAHRKVNVDDDTDFDNFWKDVGKSIKEAGYYKSGNIHFIQDGSLMPAFALNTGKLDWIYGAGGAPEGVLNAAIIASEGGDISAQLSAADVLSEEAEKADLERDRNKFNAKEIEKLAKFNFVEPGTEKEGQRSWDTVFNLKDLADPKKGLIVLASGIKDNLWIDDLKGVVKNPSDGNAEVYTVVTTPYTKATVFKTIYRTKVSDLLDKFSPLGQDFEDNEKLLLARHLSDLGLYKKSWDILNNLKQSGGVLLGRVLELYELNSKRFKLLHDMNPPKEIEPGIFEVVSISQKASSPITGLSPQEDQMLGIALRRFPNTVVTKTAAKLTSLGLRGAYKRVEDILSEKIANEEKSRKLEYLFANLYPRTGERVIAELELLMVTKKQANEQITEKELANIRQVIKDVSDGFAKRVFVETAKEEGLIMMVRVSEGFGRDEVAESLKANEVVVPDDLRGETDRVIIAIRDGKKFYRSTSGKVYGIVNAIIDVVEGTNMFVSNSDDKNLTTIEDFESGSTSVIVTGDGVADLGNSPDGYVGQFLTNLGEHAEEFKQKTVAVNGQTYSLRDPELYMAHPEKLEEYLKFLAQIRGQRLEDVQEEIVLMGRPREADMIQAIEKLRQRIPGIKIAGQNQKGIKDGTVAHGLKAVMTPQMFEALAGKAYGLHKTVLTVGGAAEGFMNLAIAGGFKAWGAVGGVRVLSGEMNKDEQGVEMKDKSQRYNFRVNPKKPEGNEPDNIRNLREQYGDAEEILTGKKVFFEDNVEGAVTGAFSFISTNGVFSQEGVVVDGQKAATVNVLGIEAQPGRELVLAIVNNKTAENGTMLLQPFAGDSASSPVTIEEIERAVTRTLGKKVDQATQLPSTQREGLMTALEDAFYIAISPEEEDNIKTVKDVISLVIRKANAVASSPVTSDLSTSLRASEQRAAGDEVGGINLNPELLDLQIKRDGNGVPLPLPMQPIGNMHIEGFLPIIIKITPVTNLPLLLGLADTQPDSDETTPAMKAREPELISALN